MKTRIPIQNKDFHKAFEEYLTHANRSSMEIWDLIDRATYYYEEKLGQENNS